MISGIFTAVLMTAFLAIVIWAWSARNRDRFDDAALLPLRDEDRQAAAATARQRATGCGGANCCCGGGDDA